MGRTIPILFNTEMVLGILEGRKTATRRIIKPQPAQGQNHRLGICVDGYKKDIGKYAFSTKECGGRLLYARPPCLPGDILYVRETWSFKPCIECLAEGHCSRTPVPYEDKHEVPEGCYIYRAGCAAPERTAWRPSIHMPKEAARIWLKVTDVRVERLQKMNADDLKAEGFMEHSLDDLERGFDRLAVKFEYERARNRFASLWDSTIHRGQQDLYGWEANPWVWAIGFERCGRPEGQHVPSDNP